MSDTRERRKLVTDCVCRALAYVVLEPVAVAADRSDERIRRINYVGWLSYDIDATAAVVGASCLFSNNSPHLRKLRSLLEHVGGI